MPDVIVLGGGIAGVSLCAALADRASVALIEPEAHLGFHATGRSAAMFFESYGNATIQALTRASRSFFMTPPEAFTEYALSKPRDCLWIRGVEEEHPVPFASSLHWLDLDDACRRVPILRRDRLTAAAMDVTGCDIDVDALLQGYARIARSAGVTFVMEARDVRAERLAHGWRVRVGQEVFEAPRLVNAAGAWADQVAQAAGVRPVGLRPLRRSAVTVPAPAEHDVADWPMVIDAGESFYFKPDAGQLMISPANEDEDLPGDAAPDELDVAIAVDRFVNATTYDVRRISRRWAGLRSFVADRSPVLGYDPDVPGFFWLAGQGGYGIQTAPAMSQIAAACLLGEVLPSRFRDFGVDLDDLAPSRPGLSFSAAPPRAIAEHA